MIFVSQCVQYKRLTYGSDYSYPLWADIVGILISLSSMVWIPLYAIYYVFSGPGSILEVGGPVSLVLIVMVKYCLSQKFSPGGAP